MEARTRAVRPVEECVRWHQGPMAESVDAGWWITSSSPVGSSSVSVESVMKHTIWRMTSHVGSRPVIYIEGSFFSSFWPS